MTVTESFAQWATDVTPPEQVRAAARRCLLDTLGGMVAGSVRAPATLLAKALPGTGPARVVSHGTRDPRTAALINGAASHTVEVDDIYSPGLYHPGVCVIPAALAMADTERATGEALLDGIITGYEVSNRIARAVNPSHYAYWHTTATVGHFGATIAAARATGLTAAQTAHALGNAVTMAAGLRHAFSGDAMTKPLHAGRAAEAGVLAALSARAGVTGIPDMLEGERGFGAAMSEAPDWPENLATLGDEWTITRMTVKAHACCGHNFATLDGIREIMTTERLTAGEIATIHARVYRATAEICGNPKPATAAEAQFSLPYTAAVMARRGAVVPSDFSEEALADTATRKLAERVSFEIDPAHEAAFPSLRPATTEITTTDGRTFSHTQPTRKGDPDAPLSEAEITAKFHALAAPVIGVAGAQALEAAIAGIDQVEDLRVLPLGPAERSEHAAE